MGNTRVNTGTLLGNRCGGCQHVSVRIQNLNAATTRGAPAVNCKIMLTVLKIRSNVYWGGELKEKADGVIFVLVANIKGLSLDRQGSQYDNYCRVLRSTQVDIACGQQEQFGYLSEETSCARQHNSTGKEIESTLPWSLWKKKTSQTRWNVHLVGRKHYKQVSKWMIPRQMGSMD